MMHALPVQQWATVAVHPEHATLEVPSGASSVGGSGLRGVYRIDAPVLPPVANEADLRRLAEQQPDDLIDYANLRGVGLGLRACAVDALSFLKDEQRAVAEAVAIFQTRDIILQEAALGVLLHFRTSDRAANFIKRIAEDECSSEDELIVELAKEMIADHF